MNLHSKNWAMMGAAAALALVAGLSVTSPQPALAQSSEKDMAKVMPDPYQRSVRIYEYRKAAVDGPKRGEEIFYYKCNFCHNDYTRRPPEFPLGAPLLRGLFERKTLMNGADVTDESVKQKIHDGGPGMPSFQYTLSDSDMNDLVSYLHNCCWNPDSPPPNPQYIAK